MSDAAVATPDVSSGGEVTESSGYAAMEAALDAPETEVAEESPAEETVEAEPEVEAAEAEPEAEAAEEAQPAEAAAPAETEELPEGVSVRERNGHKEYVLRENRYQLIYDAYKNMQEAEQILGVEVTPDQIRTRQDAFLSQEAMIGDFMSGDPNAETRFLDQFARWAYQARENGEIEHDHMRNLAERLPRYLSQIGHSDALEAMASPLVAMKLEQLYQQAVQRNEQELFLSLQWVDRALHGKYRTKEDLASPDPLKVREANLNAREQQWQEREQRARQAEISRWRDTTATKITGAVADTIAEALKPVEAAYQSFPVEFQGVKDLIQKDFQEALRKDTAWQQFLTATGNRAANAVSPKVREAAAAELETRYREKAKYFLNPARNPRLKEIMSQRANALKAHSDAAHQRQQQAAKRREPGAAGTPVPRRVVETPNGMSTADAWRQAVERW